MTNITRFPNRPAPRVKPMHECYLDAPLGNLMLALPGIVETLEKVITENEYAILATYANNVRFELESSSLHNVETFIDLLGEEEGSKAWVESEPKTNHNAIYSNLLGLVNALLPVLKKLTNDK